MPKKLKLTNEEFQAEIFRTIKINGLFCSAILTPKSIFSVKAVWSCKYEFERVGDDSLEATAEEKIAYSISSVFPDFLDRVTLTPPQLQELLFHHDQSIFLAATISSEIEEILETKKAAIPSNLQNHINKDAAYIQHLWFIINSHWVYLKNSLEKNFEVSYDSALTLFARIIQTEILRRFSPCLLEYHVTDRKSFREVYNLQKNFLRRKYTKDRDTEKVNRCNELWKKLHIQPNFLWDVTLESLELLSADNSSLRKDLDCHNKLLAKLFSFQERICYEGKDEYPQTWYKGISIPGTVSKGSIEDSIWQSNRRQK